MRILVADDDSMSRHLLNAALRKLDHEVVAVADGELALEALLADDGPRLAILDWMMPGLDGLSVCRELRARSQTYVYVVLLTARDSAADMITALEAGADDFLSKPYDVGELRARLRSGIRVLDLQRGLLDAQEALRLHATRDDLTGVWNRRVVLEQLERELTRVRHERRPLAIALADIDYFKRVNDTFGHAAGDAVLREVARRIASNIREYDSIGRYGGEEFLILLGACDECEATKVAERIRAAVAETPISIETQYIDITVSIGLVSTFNASLASAQLVEGADAALYRAKANGRNRVETG